MAVAIAENPAVADEEIVGRIRQGETELFETIMRRYNQPLFRVARSIVGDDLEAEDVLQETYVKVFEHLGQFAGTAKFSTWLTRIVVNESISRLRRQKRCETLDDPERIHVKAKLSAKAPGPEEEAAQEQIRQLLEAAVDQLPDAYRSVFVMRAVNGMTTAETAQCLGLTDENVKIRMHRARARLRQRLTEQFGTVARDAFQFLGYRCDRIVNAVLYRIRALR